MIEDRLLIWKFKHGSKDALRRIYEKYSGFLLTLATALLHDANKAEDVVHDFFVSFAQSGEKLRLNGSFKWYLATCVTNRARDRLRAKQLQTVGLDEADSVYSDANEPESAAVCNEELGLVQKRLILGNSGRGVMVSTWSWGFRFVVGGVGGRPISFG